MTATLYSIFFFGAVACVPVLIITLIVQTCSTKWSKPSSFRRRAIAGTIWITVLALTIHVWMGSYTKVATAESPDKSHTAKFSRSLELFYDDFEQSGVLTIENSSGKVVARETFKEYAISPQVYGIDLVWQSASRVLILEVNDTKIIKEIGVIDMTESNSEAPEDPTPTQ